MRLTQPQIDNLSLGAANAWHHDRPSPHTETNAVGHSVEGLPLPFKAEVHGFGKAWGFRVFGASNKMLHSSATTYESKEAALAGLQDWLNSTDLQ